MLHSILGLLALLPAASPAPPAEVRLWRLDCGSIDNGDFGRFSDSHRYDGRPYRLTDSCYLIKHGDDYMLWDTGLSGALEGKTVAFGDVSVTVKERLVPQLARIGVSPAQIKLIGVSHRHADHTGQAGDFPGATLLIGAEDLEALKASKDPSDRGGVLPWLEGGAKADPVTGDRDIFGDGSVTMLAMPGHTPGHHALLVRLRKRGWVLLSGDQFHARESYEKNEVPTFNWNRADTLASSDRFRNIAANLKAVVIVQHEPGDVAKLPAFPASAD